MTLIVGQDRKYGASPSPTPIADGMTWAYLIAREPRLKLLYDEARTITGICWSCRWHGYRERGKKHQPMRDRMARLIGWECKHPDPAVRSERAYDLTYMKLVHALPRDPSSVCRVCKESCN
jgi:hypothetical protein